MQIANFDPIVETVTAPAQKPDGTPALLEVTEEGKLKVDLGSATVNFTGDVTVSNEVEIKNDSNSPIPVTSANGSLTIVTNTAPTSSAELVAANAQRKFLLFQNLSSHPVHLNFGAAATTATLRLDAGAALSFEGVFVPTNSIHLLGTQSGQNYYLAHA
jgi:hypothetical protein